MTTPALLPVAAPQKVLAGDLLDTTPVTIFDHIFAPVGSPFAGNLRNFLGAMQAGRWRAQAETARRKRDAAAAAGQDVKKAWGDAKKPLPNVVFGKFKCQSLCRNPRPGKMHRANQDCDVYAPLPMLDFDGVGTPEETLEILDGLIANPPNFLLAAYPSVSQKGLRLRVLVENPPADLAGQALADWHSRNYPHWVAQVKEQAGLACDEDKSTRNLTRADFVSDPVRMYIAPDDAMLTPLAALPMDAPPDDGEDDDDVIWRPSAKPRWDLPADAGQAESALAAIPVPQEYHEWFAVAVAAGAAEVSEAAGEAWASQGAKYRPGEIARLWASTDLNPGAGQISAGTLFHIAKQHGWQPPQRQSGRAPDLCMDCGADLALPDGRVDGECRVCRGQRIRLGVWQQINAAFAPEPLPPGVKFEYERAPMAGKCVVPATRSVIAVGQPGDQEWRSKVNCGKCPTCHTHWQDGRIQKATEGWRVMGGNPAWFTSQPGSPDAVRKAKRALLTQVCRFRVEGKTPLGETDTPPVWASFTDGRWLAILVFGLEIGDAERLTRRATKIDWQVRPAMLADVHDAVRQLSVKAFDRDGNAVEPDDDDAEEKPQQMRTVVFSRRWPVRERPGCDFELKAIGAVRRLEPGEAPEELPASVIYRREHWGLDDRQVNAAETWLADVSLPAPMMVELHSAVENRNRHAVWNVLYRLREASGFAGPRTLLVDTVKAMQGRMEWRDYHAVVLAAVDASDVVEEPAPAPAAPTPVELAPPPAVSLESDEEQAAAVADKTVGPCPWDERPDQEFWLRYSAALKSLNAELTERNVNG